MAVIKIVPMPGAVGDKGDEGAPGPQGQQGPAGQNGLPGTPALWSYQGAYNSAAAYAVGDVVVYQGQLYYTKSVTTAGTLPTNTTKFDLIAAKGADGQPGTNGSDGAPGAGFGIFYLGNYNASSGYVPDIAVVRGSDGQLYLAKASGQLGDPVGNTAQWEVWIPKGADGTNGTNGTNGADGATPFTLIGAYDNGASYNLGIAVYYNGGTYVRTGNPLNPGYPPEVGAVNASWTPIAEKGADSIAPTSGTWNPMFAELSGITYSNSEQYEMGKYYCVGDLVFFDLTVHLGYVSDWGNPTAPTYNNFKFKLPFEMPGSGLGVIGQSGPGTRIPFLGQILENYTDPLDPSTWSMFPVFGLSTLYNDEVNVYSTMGGMNQSFQPVTSLWPSNFNQSQGGSNSSFSMSGVYRKA